MPLEPQGPIAIVEMEDVLEVRQLITNLRNFSRAFGIANEKPSAGIHETVPQSVKTEENEQRHCDAAVLIDGDVSDHRLEPLRGKDAYPIARLQA